MSDASAPAEETEPVEPTAPQLKAAGVTFGLLSVPTRLHLMWLLARRESDVGQLAERTGASVAAVSQHLAKLRLAGLVTSRRQGRHQIYALEDPHVLTMVEQMFDHIAPDGSLAPDPPAPYSLTTPPGRRSAAGGAAPGAGSAGP